MKKILLIIMIIFLIGCSKDPSIEKIPFENINDTIRHYIEVESDADGAHLVDLSDYDYYFIFKTSDQSMTSEIIFKFDDESDTLNITLKKSDLLLGKYEPIQVYQISNYHKIDQIMMKDDNNNEIPFKSILLDLIER